MSDKTIIEMSGIKMDFGGFKAISDFELDLREGEFFSLLGPSGCGKTTAMRIIAGFQDPTAGSVRIDGADMNGVPANRRPTNMVFQNYAIFPHLNVRDNVAFGLRNQRLPADELKSRVAGALDMVALGGLEGRAANELSGGQRQRVALARALIMQPRVLLLDEPLSALDKKLREQMQHELRNLQRTLGITFVMVTHDQYEAMGISDRIGVMFDGKLVQVATPQMLYARPCNRDVAAFIGGMNFLEAKVIKRDGKKIGVDMPCFGKLDIPVNPDTGHAESDILLGIRPEQIEITGTKSGGASLRGVKTAEGTVSDLTFYGEMVNHHVTMQGGDITLVVSTPNKVGSAAGSADIKTGERVQLGINEASVIDLGAPDRG